MSRFRNTFLSFASGGCDAEAWKPYFANYDPIKWDAEGDGVFQFYSDDAKEYLLVIVHWSGFGFLLQSACRNLATNRSEWCKFAVGNMDLLGQFEERDDFRYPLGCFLSASNAWLVVEDFFAFPTAPSSRVMWVDDGDIPWPE